MLRKQLCTQIHILRQSICSICTPIKSHRDPKVSLAYHPKLCIHMHSHDVITLTLVHIHSIISLSCLVLCPRHADRKDSLLPVRVTCIADFWSIASTYQSTVQSRVHYARSRYRYPLPRTGLIDALVLPCLVRKYVHAQSTCTLYGVHMYLYISSVQGTVGYCICMYGGIQSTDAWMDHRKSI